LRRFGPHFRHAINTLHQTRVTGSDRASPAFSCIHIINLCRRPQDNEIRRLLLELDTAQGPRIEHLPELRRVSANMRRPELRSHGHDRGQQLLVR
jgi:hypothetical protein